MMKPASALVVIARPTRPMAWAGTARLASGIRVTAVMAVKCRPTMPSTSRPAGGAQAQTPLTFWRMEKAAMPPTAPISTEATT